MLQRFPVLQTRDLSEAREAVAERFCDHKLTLADGARSLSARHNHVGGQNLSFNMLGYGADVIIDPGMLGSFYLLQIPLSGTACIRHRGEEVDASRRLGTLLNADRPTSMLWRADCRKALLQVDRSFLEHVAEEELDTVLPGPIRFDPAVDLSSRHGQRLRDQVLTCIRAIDHGALYGRGLSLSELNVERELALALLSLQPSNISHMMWQRDERVLPQSLRRALDYIHTNYAHSMRINDIALNTGIGVRSLQIGFKRVFGLSPLQYLRAVRLDAARYRLSARRNRESVTDVAYGCGFTHLGRFSHDYRARFGHLPSETP
ncbi:MAG: AraC family transcriptional regulator [Pseudomonadota bacterium]